MEGLGIDLKLLIVQIINFLVLLLILKKFVYPGFIKFLDDRAGKIHESLTASEKMRKDLKEFEAQKDKELHELKKNSQKILEEVRGEAFAEKQKIMEKTAEEAKNMVDGAKLQIEMERKKAVKDINSQIANLSIEIAKKILSDVDEKKAHVLVKEALNEEVDEATIKQS